MKITVKNILKKKGVEKLAMITAYDAIFARLADSAKVDIILVGDSLGNTVLGMESTVSVTIDDMVHHTRAVARAKPDALIVADLPFACAHYSFDKLLDYCKKLIQEGGADAIKIEGGKEISDKVEKLVNAGIAIMAHIGLQPQQILRLGGYRKFGKTDEEKLYLKESATALEKAGAFCILMEMTDSTLAQEITNSLNVPTIGIGSGVSCDGQVLVCADVLGLSEFVPSFVKQYANLKEDIIKAYSAYVSDVKELRFPKE